MSEESWLYKKGGGSSSAGTLGRHHHREKRRIHGLQVPLHPLQVVGWLVVAVIIAFMYGAVVPALHSSFVAPVAAASGTLFLAHILAHATALILDPAHPLLRGRKDKRIVPEFDRALHSHVIENGRCHLCNITITSVRTKHCSACNKCVDVFDHHCKWLNNCIGRRNYRVFLVTVITAILSCLMVMATCLTEIILYYFNRQYLAPWEHGIPTISPADEVDDNEHLMTCIPGAPYCHFSVFGATVYDGAFIGILSTLFSVALVAGVLLLHLVAFHAYLLFLGLTTYEYIRGTSIPGSTSANSFGGRSDVARDGATCGWKVKSHTASNQITPSSTTDTALLSSPDPPSTTTTSPGTLSPKSNPSTPADDTHHLLGGRHLMVHHKQNAQPLSPRGLPSSRPSSVPTLPKIGGNNKTSLHTVSKAVASATENENKGFSSDDDDVTVHLVSIPRPPRVSRRRLRSSVTPHLSPIKECDIASSSPPSVRTFKDVMSDSPIPGQTPSISPISHSKSNSNSSVKSTRLSPRPSRSRPSPSRSSKPYSHYDRDRIIKVAGRDQQRPIDIKSSPKVPSPRKKIQPRGVLSKSKNNVIAPYTNNSKGEKSPSRPQSAPAEIHIIKKSSSFSGTNRIGTPTLRFKIPHKETNGHIITGSTDATLIDCETTNGNLLSIVRSQSDGLLIKMGDVTRGGVYIGPHKSDILADVIAARDVRTIKSFVEHHM